MYNTILVPVDLSHTDSGVSSIKLAGKLLNKGGKIVLVNVIENVPSYIEAELPVGIFDKTKELALAQLTKIAENAGIGSNIEIRQGPVAASILEAAVSHEAGIIIIGSHRPGFTDYFLGSTAARVVRHAQCPVLVNR